MDQATQENQTNQASNPPVIYPARVYNGTDFEPNLNRAQSSDNLTTVLTDKNEVLGFPDNTSKQEMQAAIEADRNGSISTYKPTFYDKFIREPLSAMGIDAFQPKFITDIKPSPERAFATSLARAATADVFKPVFSDQEAKAYPAFAFAGSLAGSIAAFGTGGALLDGFKLSQLTPFAENIIKGGLLGGAYRGVAETSNELRDQDHPDLVKIGQGVLHDALWWGGISGLAGAASKPVGVAASAGLGYLMAKSDGADEPTALLNGAVLGGFHLLQAHGDQEDVRQFVTDKLQSNIADYILAKNPMVHPIVADQAGRELISNYAQDVIERYNARLTGLETPQAAEIEGKIQGGLPETGIETPQAKEIEQKTYIPRPAKPFTDGYDPKAMDFLSNFIPPDRIVRMSASDRLWMANLPLDKLEVYKAQYEAIQKIIAGEKAEAQKPEIPEVEKMISEGGPIIPKDEAAKSQTILNDVMKTMTKQVMLKEEGEDAGESGKSLESGGGQTQELAQGEEERLRVWPSPSHGLEAKAGEEIANQSNQPRRESGNNPGDELAGPSDKEQLPKQEELNKPPQESQPIVGQESSSKESITPKVEEGNKTSGLSKSVEEDAIHKGLVENLGDLPSYKTRDMAEIAKKVSDFINKDPELAKKIALGEAPEQDGLRAQELFTGLRVKAFKEGDIGLINELGTSEKASAMATELGQRVKALDSQDEENPVKIVQDVQKARASKPPAEQKDVIKQLKDEMKKPKLKQNDWDSFIQSIRC